MILFNLIALSASISAWVSQDRDLIARRGVALAIALWTIGSFASSWNSFSTIQLPDLVSDFGYVAFYPILFFSLMRTLHPARTQQRIQILDSFIAAVGISAILATFTLDIAISRFELSNAAGILLLFYPIADLILVACALLIVIRAGINRKNGFLLLATLAFALTDFIFLIRSAEGSYRFASLVDIGWLIALILIAESLWHPGSERGIREKTSILISVIAATGSGLIIALASVAPQLLPKQALIPAFLTLALSFLRMAIALNHAHRLNHESVMARTDELTGLANRRAFLERIAEVEVGQTLLLLDLNGFKPVNDRYGHATGDQLLQQVAHRLGRLIESDWTLARLGGDEFALLTSSSAQASESAAAVSAAFTYPFHLEGIGDVQVGASIGAVIADGDGDLLRRADMAMYQAKRAGVPLLFWSSTTQQGITVAPLNR
ncbi:MAG: GGDEF domain-containing protein [Actinobacteria bacterium]|nr:GGDEF domain-containing protein [Actinomycetota bacterium]